VSSLPPSSIDNVDQPENVPREKRGTSKNAKENDLREMIGLI